MTILSATKLREFWHWVRGWNKQNKIRITLTFAHDQNYQPTCIYIHICCLPSPIIIINCPSSNLMIFTSVLDPTPLIYLRISLSLLQMSHLSCTWPFSSLLDHSHQHKNMLWQYHLQNKKKKIPSLHFKIWLHSLLY